MPVGIDFGVKKVYKSPKSIHRADAKGLTSSSKLSVSCVLTLQTLPLITFTPLHLLILLAATGSPSTTVLRLLLGSR